VKKDQQEESYYPYPINKIFALCHFGFTAIYAYTIRMLQTRKNRWQL
jgi:hypothetical protein